MTAKITGILIKRILQKENYLPKKWKMKPFFPMSSSSSFFSFQFSFFVLSFSDKEQKVRQWKNAKSSFKKKMEKNVGKFEIFSSFFIFISYFPTSPTLCSRPFFQALFLLLIP
jgi:hypothetical protein